jgi:hypothetical protein
MTQVKIEGKKLTIIMDIEPYTSASGKSKVIASTHGNLVTTAQYDGKPIVVGINCYTKN